VLIQDKVKVKLEESDFVVAIYTKSHPSRSVDQEVGMARHMGKKVIPLAEKGIPLGMFAEPLDRQEFEESNFEKACDRVAEGIYEATKSRHKAQ
jgi:hypothetical protein